MLNISNGLEPFFPLRCDSMFRVSIVVTTTLNGLLSCLSSTLEDPQFCPISNPKTIHFKHPFSNHISNSLKTLFETPQKLYSRPLKKIFK